MIPMLKKRYFLGMATTLSPAAQLLGKVNYNFNSYPGKVVMDLEIPNFASLQGKYTVFELPLFTNFARLVDINDNRQTTMWQDSNEVLTYQWNITIPSNLKVVNVNPGKLEIGSPNSAKFVKTIKIKDNLLQIKVKLELQIEEVTLDKYKI
jgi:hypothetical protein